MPLNLNLNIDLKALFFKLYNSKTEDDVQSVIDKNTDVFQDENWFPLGGDENMFGIVRNQQSSPIAALVEKITNSIDAVLMKKCWEQGINPISQNAPKSMDQAIEKFYPNHKQWDLGTFRRKQAEDIQIVADGPPRNTAVIIYDNGEGQHPDKFEDTFLSLVRGNKINIHFVQGKYNMGGSGALVFCGRKRFQLIGSKRYDNTGNFGFTLVRQRKISQSGTDARSSHFEYFKINKNIPSFTCDELDLGLHNRTFKTGSLIKLYSYQFPSGYSGFAQELNQSLNEFLFEPVLPLFTVDKKERYPNNKVLELDLFGLKRRLEEDKNDYVEDYFSEVYVDQLFGRAKVTCYVFRPKIKDRDAKKSKEIIRDRFFKNNMSVMFSINGQVHGSYTSEFITRTLKFNLLKDYLLIHVDCTHMNPDFREELFMASRDRLKDGDDSRDLRDFLGKKLRKSHLDDINRKRKESIGFDSEDTNDLLKSFAKNLPKDSDLFNLLQNTLNLEEIRMKKESKKHERNGHHKDQKTPFLPKRFPSFFRIHKKTNGHETVISIPQNGEKVVKFDTDVENQYFDRTDEPGDLIIGLLDVNKNESNGGDMKGAATDIASLLSIVKSSPNSGTVRISINPTNELNVGDEIRLKVSLTGSSDPFEEILLVKVKEKESPPEKSPLEDESQENIGLPELKKVREAEWNNLESQGIPMGYERVMYPVGEGNILERIIINLDSNVYLRYRSKLKSENQLQIAEKRYLASVYFHTLFLYMITKKRNYKLSIVSDGQESEVTVDEYIRDLFDSYYSDFLLNFGMEQLINSLED